MAKTDVTRVDDYIASQPEAVQRVLARVRSAIRKAVPGAEKYPSTDRVLAAFKDDLVPYEVNKGTIRFPLSGAVPVKLIEGIAKVRAKEVAEREQAKAAAPKKR